MFTDPFVKCTPTEIETTLGLLDRIMPDHGFRSVGLLALKKPLSFYDRATLYELTQADQHPAKNLGLVICGKEVLICDGQSASILAYNNRVPFRLDQNLVLDYARFYLAHVVGVHGQPHVIDTVEDLLLAEEPTPGLRKSLNDKIIPFALNASLAGGGYQLRGTLLIERSLFGVLIDVDTKGEVKPHPARILAEILPVIDRVLEG